MNWEYVADGFDDGYRKMSKLEIRQASKILAEGIELWVQFWESYGTKEKTIPSNVK